MKTMSVALYLNTRTARAHLQILSLLSNLIHPFSFRILPNIDHLTPLFDIVFRSELPDDGLYKRVVVDVRIGGGDVHDWRTDGVGSFA